MLKLKHNIRVIIMAITILLILGGQCLASVAVTEENLASTFQEFINSSDNDGGYKASVASNVISITADEENYEMNYDLTSNPTFTLEIPITKGMSYSDFESKTGNILLPMLGYISVANIQGVEFKDASAYFAEVFLSSVLTSTSTTTYTIVDDLNVESGITVESTDENTIYTSEFGDKVIDYVNDVYKNEQTISDTNGINSFVWTVERKNVTDTSCTLVSSLRVNLDANFSKIKGYAENLEDDITISQDNEDQTEEEEEKVKDNTIITSDSENKISADVTTRKNVTNVTSEDKDNLPQTGINETLSIIIALSIIFLIVSLIKYRKYKDLK